MLANSQSFGRHFGRQSSAVTIAKDDLVMFLKEMQAAGRPVPPRDLLYVTHKHFTARNFAKEVPALLARLMINVAYEKHSAAARRINQSVREIAVQLAARLDTTALLPEAIERCARPLWVKRKPQQYPYRVN